MLITAISAAFGGASGGGGESGMIYDGVDAAIGAFGLSGNQGDDVPAAYLNYILFDQGYNVLDMGWESVTSSSYFNKSKIDFDPITIKEAGYIFVYLSYENQSNNYVYFDDFKVTHTKSNVIQYNEYYPFGLQTSSSWTREEMQGNDYKYNAGSELNATTGWYEMFFRGYDPALGRMFEVDPFASDYLSVTPYNYALNNPSVLSDPSGGSTPELREWSRELNATDWSVRMPGSGVKMPGSGQHWSDAFADAYSNSPVAFIYDALYSLEGGYWNDSGTRHFYSGGESMIVSQMMYEAISNAIRQSSAYKGSPLHDKYIFNVRKDRYGNNKSFEYVGQGKGYIENVWSWEYEELGEIFAGDDEGYQPSIYSVSVRYWLYKEPIYLDDGLFKATSYKWKLTVAATSFVSNPTGYSVRPWAKAGLVIDDQIVQTQTLVPEPKTLAPGDHQYKYIGETTWELPGGNSQVVVLINAGWEVITVLGPRSPTYRPILSSLAGNGPVLKAKKEFILRK